MVLDEQNRLIQISMDSNTHRGHSACHECEKDMPICWDTVCYHCGLVSCYEHSFTEGKYWYCREHYQEFVGIIPLQKTNS